MAKRKDRCFVAGNKWADAATIQRQGPREGKIGQQVLVSLARQFLTNYPEEMFDGSSGDSGPAFIVNLRAALTSFDAHADYQEPKT